MHQDAGSRDSAIPILLDSVLNQISRKPVGIIEGSQLRSEESRKIFAVQRPQLQRFRERTVWAMPNAGLIQPIATSHVPSIKPRTSKSVIWIRTRVRHASAHNVLTVHVI